MAFPTVVTSNTTFDDAPGSALGIAYPSGITVGDLVIVCFGYGTTGNTIDWSSSEATELPNGSVENTAGATEGIITGYRWIVGGESVISVTASVATRHNGIAIRISGAENPATQAPEAANAIMNNVPPDPPSLTPTGGAKDYLWIACGARTRSSADEDLASAPTDYSGLVTSANSVTGANFTTGGIAVRQLNAASENPGAFGGVGIVGESAAVTIAIHPLSVAPPTVKRIYQVRSTQRW